MIKPLALILFATGTNRDQDAAQALELAGARAEIVPINRLRFSERRWDDYQMLVIPGGFSYADALGAGKLLALDLQSYFSDEVGRFVQQGKPVIGICNGFQALVKSGILPGGNDNPAKPRATLTFNDHGHFECRWVTLVPQSQKCVWTRGLEWNIQCPVAHGEGRFLAADVQVLQGLKAGDQVALRYASPDGLLEQAAYPYNPNGSDHGIAGICNPQGNVLGLMPHPENNIFAYQHPGWHRSGDHGGAQLSGLPLFQQGVRYASEL